MGERGKIVGREYFSLQDGEIDFNLVDPAGMNGSVDQKSVGPSGSNAFHGFLTAMSRAVIHDPENTLSRLVGLAPHHFRDEPVGGSNAAFLFTVSEELGTMDVPSRQIGPSAFPEILMLRPHGSAGDSRPTGLLTASRLNTSFFIRGDDELRTMQGFSLPDSSVEIENASGFVGEVRIPRKDPTSMLPRTNGVGTEPTPECGAADLGDDALSDHLLADIGQGQARERQPEAMRQLTGERLLLVRRRWGEKRAGRPPRGCSSRPGRRASANRLRHLLTIWRGVSRRAAMTSLDRPWAARRTILALMTSRYGDVYFRALVSSSYCSSLERTM